MTVNSFDSIPQSIAQRAISQNHSQEEKARREAMLVNKEFYYGNQEKHLSLLNEDVDPLILNVTKPVIKKRASLLYRRPLVREMEGPRASVSFLEQVYAENNLDGLLLQADLAAELTGTGLVHVGTSDSPKFPSGIKLRLYDASEFSALQRDDDPSEIEALSIISLVTRLAARSTPQNPQAETLIKQQVWTDSAVVSYEGAIGAFKPLSAEQNPLGFMPFVLFKGDEVNNQLYGHAPGMIVRLLNEDINQKLTELGYMIKLQSGTPIALSGYLQGEGVTIHPGRALSLPAGADAKVLQTNPKILESLELIKYLEEKMFETSSVPKVSVIGGGEARSGRELLVRWFPLVQFAEEKAVRFDRYELDLANMILAVAGLPLLTSLKVHWPFESLLPLSAEEESLEQDIRLNIKTPIDEVMRRDPLLEESEAEAIVRANKDFNDSLSGTLGNEMISLDNTEEVQDESQESPGEERTEA